MPQAPKSKTIHVTMAGGPHNGEGKPSCQFPDPVTGEMIGGQVAAMRMTMRYPHCTLAWARRTGKTKGRMYVLQNEGKITSGMYWAGIVYPDHTSAAKIAENFRDSWGGMVKNSHINAQDQERWIELYPFAPPEGDPPAWFTPKLVARWRRCQNGEPNTGSKIYFWGGAMPHARKIQGFPHPFHRIDFDECQEQDPTAYDIVRPMLRDVRGHECFSGTPWSSGIGNVQFERFFDIGLDKTSKGWFSYRIPDGANPHVPGTDLAEARKSMSESSIRQTMFAAFISDAGSVFTNLDRVFTIAPIDPESPECDWIRAVRSKFNMPSIAWWVGEANPREGHVYGASIDWARSPKGDYSCLSVFDFSTGRQVFVARWRGEDFTAQMEVVLAIQSHYRASQLHSDGNGMGEPMSDFMRRRHAVGFVAHRFGRNKSDYVRRGQILFVDASISMIACDEQRREFKDFSAFEAEGVGSEKQVKYCAPEGDHDDFVASFLQLAPTLTIVGRQIDAPPDPEKAPLLDEAGKTSLESWADSMNLPFEWKQPDPSQHERGFSFDDIVVR